ncbi:DNA-binding response regulator [Clostridia bacterium]|nr:DNA-binding response regulator [Clostridia bacterium]
MQTILIVEDDETIRRELAVLIERYGFAAKAADKFDDIVNWILSEKAHLVLLDINLPYFDGHHICREIRKNSNVPIIVVTSQSGETDELMSMNLGADDFVAKPYNTRILLARIQNVLRRAYGDPEESAEVTVRGLSLNLNNSSVSHGDGTRELTKNEVRILRLLMAHAGTIVSREKIMTELWQSDEFVDDNTLTVNINRLRKKLAEIGAAGFIGTKKGQGYMI